SPSATGWTTDTRNRSPLTPSLSTQAVRGRIARLLYANAEPATDPVPPAIITTRKLPRSSGIFRPIAPTLPLRRVRGDLGRGMGRQRNGHFQPQGEILLQIRCGWQNGRSAPQLLVGSGVVARPKSAPRDSAATGRH